MAALVAVLDKSPTSAVVWMMIAVLIEQQLRETLNWQFAAALSFVLLATTLAVYALVQRFAHAEPTP